MTAHTSMLHVRVDEATKEQATETLASMGMTMTEAVRILLHRIIATQSFPVELKAPNAETKAAMKEARNKFAARRNRFTSAEELFDDLEKDGRK